MRIMSRGRPEAAILMQTREHKIDYLVARKGIRTAEQMQGRQSPVEAIYTEMLREPVLELVFALGATSAMETGCGRVMYRL